MAERGTREFYREQALRLVGLASEVASAAIKLELLEIASVFHKLAERSARIVNLRDVSERKSA